MSRIKILVVGGSGFIGLPLVKKLSESGHEVMALSRKYIQNSSEENSVNWLQSDLSSPKTYRKEVKDFSPNIVIYLSWQDIPDFSFDKSLLNLNQSLKFFNFLSELESCKKIIVSGSCLEYNQNSGECLESDSGQPRDNFTWAKHALLSWLEAECKKKRYSVSLDENILCLRSTSTQ